MYKVIILFSFLVIVAGYPEMFQTQTFKTGIEYQGSLPMSGGSDRYRHRNNLDPFYVTVTANAKDGYVITYLKVSATTDIIGSVEFNMVQGQTGSKRMVFQLISNQTDFLKYHYLAYGIKEDKYKKYEAALEPVWNITSENLISNIITLQL